VIGLWHTLFGLVWLWVNGSLVRFCLGPVWQKKNGAVLSRFLSDPFSGRKREDLINGACSGCAFGEVNLTSKCSRSDRGMYKLALSGFQFAAAIKAATRCTLADNRDDFCSSGVEDLWWW